jgi:hypothetical protein
MAATMVAVVFLSVLQVTSKEPYTLNRFFRREPNGVRLFNRYSLAYFVPLLFVPFIGVYAFRYLFIIFILIFFLALEDVLYLYSLYRERNKENVLTMLVFNLVMGGLIFLVYRSFLYGIVSLPGLV